MVEMIDQPITSAPDDGGGSIRSHLTGNPLEGMDVAPVTVIHTLAIVVGALILLWLFGGVLFKNIRM